MRPAGVPGTLQQYANSVGGGVCDGCALVKRNRYVITVQRTSKVDGRYTN